jgi:hypothetical protein
MALILKLAHHREGLQHHELKKNTSNFRYIYCCVPGFRISDVGRVEVLECDHQCACQKNNLGSVHFLVKNTMLGC